MSTIAGDVEFLSQTAAKLLAVKFGVLKKKSAASAIPPKIVCNRMRPGFDPGRARIIFKV